MSQSVREDRKIKKQGELMRRNALVPWASGSAFKVFAAALCMLAFSHTGRADDFLFANNAGGTGTSGSFVQVITLSNPSSFNNGGQGPLIGGLSANFAITVQKTPEPGRLCFWSPVWLD